MGKFTPDPSKLSVDTDLLAQAEGRTQAKQAPPLPTKTAVFEPPETDQLAEEGPRFANEEELAAAGDRMRKLGEVTAGQTSAASKPKAKFKPDPSKLVAPAKYGRGGIPASADIIKEKGEKDEAAETARLHKEYVKKYGEEPGDKMSAFGRGAMQAYVPGGSFTTTHVGSLFPGASVEQQRAKEELLEREYPTSTGVGRVVGNIAPSVFAGPLGKVGGWALGKAAGPALKGLASKLPQVAEFAEKAAPVVGRAAGEALPMTVAPLAQGDYAGAAEALGAGATLGTLARTPVPPQVAREGTNAVRAWLQNKALPPAAIAARYSPLAFSTASGAYQAATDPSIAGKIEGAGTVVAPLGEAALRGLLQRGGASGITPRREAYGRVVDEAAKQWAAEQAAEKAKSVEGLTAEQATLKKKYESDVKEQQEKTLRTYGKAQEEHAAQQKAYEDAVKQAEERRQEFLTMERDEIARRKKARDTAEDIKRAEFLEQQGKTAEAREVLNSMVEKIRAEQEGRVGAAKKQQEEGKAQAMRVGAAAQGAEEAERQSALSLAEAQRDYQNAFKNKMADAEEQARFVNEAADASEKAARENVVELLGAQGEMSKDFQARQKRVDDLVELQRDQYLEAKKQAEARGEVQRRQYVADAKAEEARRLANAELADMFGLTGEEAASAVTMHEVPAKAQAFGELGQIFGKAQTRLSHVIDAIERNVVPDDPEIRSLYEFVANSLMKNNPKALAQIKEVVAAGGAEKWLAQREQQILEQRAAAAGKPAKEGAAPTPKGAATAEGAEESVEPGIRAGGAPVPRYPELEQKIFSPLEPVDPSKYISQSIAGGLQPYQTVSTPVDVRSIPRKTPAQLRAEAGEANLPSMREVGPQPVDVRSLPRTPFAKLMTEQGERSVPSLREELPTVQSRQQIMQEWAKAFGISEPEAERFFGKRVSDEDIVKQIASKAGYETGAIPEKPKPFSEFFREYAKPGSGYYVPDVPKPPPGVSTLSAKRLSGPELDQFLKDAAAKYAAEARAKAAAGKGVPGSVRETMEKAGIPLGESVAEQYESETPKFEAPFLKPAGRAGAFLKNLLLKGRFPVAGKPVTSLLSDTTPAEAEYILREVENARTKVDESRADARARAARAAVQSILETRRHKRQRPGG